jgi:hypothetical protein
MTTLPHTPLIILGAGFSGIATAIQAERLVSQTCYEIYERSSSLGGTWSAPSASLLKTDFRALNTYRTLPISANKPPKPPFAGLVFYCMSPLSVDNSWLWSRYPIPFLQLVLVLKPKLDKTIRQPTRNPRMYPISYPSSQYPLSPESISHTSRVAKYLRFLSP